jgi:hypothetical protein
MIYTYVYNTKTVFRSFYNDDRVDLPFYKQSPWVYIDSMQAGITSFASYQRVFLYFTLQLAPTGL